jgi:hypothetical protein
MNLLWLRRTLRWGAAVLAMGAAVILFSGDLSFRNETQTSSDMDEIHRTFVFSSIAIVPAAAGMLLFALSFMVPTKKG